MSNKKKIIIAGIVVIFMLVILPVGKHYIIGPRYYEDEYDIGIYYKGEIYYPTSHIGAKSDVFIGMLDLGSPVYTVQNNENHEAAPASPSVELPGAVSPRTLCWHAAFIGAVHSAQAGNILQPARILPGRGRTGSAASLPRSSARAARRGGKVIAFLGAGWEEKNKK